MNARSCCDAGVAIPRGPVRSGFRFPEQGMGKRHRGACRSAAPIGVSGITAYAPAAASEKLCEFAWTRVVAAVHGFDFYILRSQVTSFPRAVQWRCAVSNFLDQRHSWVRRRDRQRGFDGPLVVLEKFLGPPSGRVAHAANGPPSKTLR